MMSFPRRRDCFSRSFTLLELLMVIAIIIILAAMLLPALRNARETAQMINCLSHEKQVGLGLMMYANDSTSWIPLATGVGTSHLHGPWGSVLIDGNYSDWDMMHCPATKLRPWKSLVQWASSTYTYGMRYYTSGSSKAAYYNISTRRDSEGMLISRNQSDYPVLADSAKLIGVYEWQTYWLETGNRVHIRHRKGANLLFADGHAEFKNAFQIENSGYGFSFGICYTPNP